MPDTGSPATNHQPSDRLPIHEGQADRGPAEVVLISHSPLVYWWPVWAVGFILAGVSYFAGQSFTNDQGQALIIYPDTGVGITFITVLLLVLVLTNARLKGVYSITAILAVGLAIVTLALFGGLETLLRAIPSLSVYMNTGFYLIFSLAMFSIWALAFFVFDRLTYWRVRPGQLTRERLIGDSAESFDTRGMLFEKHGEDIFRHIILGLGSGDLSLTTAGAKKQTILIPDVMGVNAKVRQIQNLISVEPSEMY